MRSARRKWKFAEHGDMNVRIEACHVFPVRKIPPLGPQRSAQFLQGINAADLLQSQDVRLKRLDAFADFSSRLSRFGMPRPGSVIQVVFQVISGNAETFRAGRTEQKGGQ